MVQQIGLLGKMKICWEIKKVLSVLYQQSGWLIQQFFFLRAVTWAVHKLSRDNNIYTFLFETLFVFDRVFPPIRYIILIHKYIYSKQLSEKCEMFRFRSLKIIQMQTYILLFILYIIYTYVHISIYTLAVHILYI